MYVPLHPLCMYILCAQASPFGSLWYSIMTIIVYTVGGPDNIMLELDDSDDHFLFPVITYLLWIVFIVAMSVLFLNLLVSIRTFKIHVYTYIYIPCLYCIVCYSNKCTCIHKYAQMYMHVTDCT